MSEDKKPKYIEKLEKEIIDLRSDVNNLANFVERLNIANLRERLLDILKLLETHKDNEAFVLAFLDMKGSLDIEKEAEEVRKYATEKGKSLKEAYDEMAGKNILPKGLRDLTQARKMIREML
jgi:hypothetical protein